MINNYSRHYRVHIKTFKKYNNMNEYLCSVKYLLHIKHYSAGSL